MTSPLRKARSVPSMMSKILHLKKSDEVANTTIDADDSSEGEEQKGKEKKALWDPKMVLPADQTRKSTNQCETDGCDLAACCIWTSKIDPEKPWSLCLDCQANDFGGWSEKNEEFEHDIREAILEECTRVKAHIMPSGSASVGEDTTKEDANILLHQYLSLLISGTLTCYWRTYAQDDVKNAIHSTLDNDSMIWSIYSGPFET